jgi:NAD-dependent SIR2 family protein deacetylase
MPRHARQAGATLAIVNLAPTPCDGHADLVVRGRAGDVMDAALARVEKEIG